MIKTLLRKLIPDRLFPSAIDLKYGATDGGAVKSYSLEGEDMILRRHFWSRRTGFYVDVGAHHPKRFSNTYYFYERGWRGINIDAMPGSSRAFQRLRPRDVTVEAAVSDKKEILKYYSFTDPALNGFSDELSAERHQSSGHRLLGATDIETQPLAEILDLHMPADTQIDFMSIDVEGLELAVLKSNNWERYRPGILAVETLNFDLKSMDENDTYTFLRDQGYNLFAKTFVTLFLNRSDVPIKETDQHCQ
ncbi:FkbM family methyltransferase [Verrucomicrobiota bacterium]